MPDLLPDELIADCANRLGATNVTGDVIVAIKNKYYDSVRHSCGCLSNEEGKRLFIAYRLRELGCFEVGGDDQNTALSGCVFHFFDIYDETRNLTEEEYAAFMRYRYDEARVAATKLWKLIDSLPVDGTAARATLFSKSSPRRVDYDRR